MKFTKIDFRKEETIGFTNIEVSIVFQNLLIAEYVEASGPVPVFFYV